MKYLFFLLFVSFPVCSQEIVSLDNIAQYKGKTVTICEKVMGTFMSKSNTVMLNFGNPYPNQTFVVVIFEKDLDNFSYNLVEDLKDKNVCITGKVKIYKGKPEFIITSEKQIKLQKH